MIQQLNYSIMFNHTYCAKCGISILCRCRNEQTNNSQPPPLPQIDISIISELDRQRAHFQQQNSGLNSENDRLQSENSHLSSQMNNLTQQCQLLDQQNNQQINISQRINNEINQTQHSITQITQQNTLLNTENSHNQHLNQNISAQNSTLRNEQRRIQSENTCLTATLSERRVELAANQSINNHLKASITRQQQRFQQYSNAIQNQRNQMRNLYFGGARTNISANLQKSLRGHLSGRDKDQNERLGEQLEISSNQVSGS